MATVVNEYLKTLEATSVKELSDKQVIAFFENGYCGNDMKFSYSLAKSAIRANKLNMNDVLSSMRTSMEEGIPFKCSYIVRESANGSDDLAEKEGWVIKP